MGFTNPYPASRLTLDTANSLANGLVAFYPLTDGTGSTAKDISTGANDGTASGTVNWLSGDVGMAADFEGFGVNGYFDTGVGTSTLGISGGSTASISVWVNYTSGGSITQNVFGDLGSGGASPNFGMYIGPTVSFVDVWRNEANARFTSVTFSGWMHFVAVYDTSNIYLYINGSLHGTIASSGSINASTGNCMIGNQPANNRNLEGQEQNVRIYNRALSATEVATLYNRPWEGTNYGTLWPYSPPAPADATLSTDTAATSLMSGCQAWWLLTDGSGSTATDVSTSGNDLSATFGTVGWLSSEKGKAADLTGTGLLSTSTTPTLTNKLTVSQWLYYEGSISRETSIAGNTSGASFSWALRTENVGDFVRFFVNGSFTDSSQLPIDQWVHVVGVYDGIDIRLYVDGILDSTPTSVTGNVSAFNNIYIGNQDGSSSVFPFTGYAQNTRIWDRALTADEITLLYERPFEGITYGDAFHYDPPTPANLTPLTSDSINNSQIGWWPLNETDDYASGAADISGNANNGTQSGGVLSEVSRLGGVASFDGANNYFDLGDNYDFGDGTTDSAFSISGWIYIDTLPAPIFSKTSESSSTTSVSCYVLSVNSSGVLGFRLYDQNGGNQIRALSAASSFSTGQWYHLAGTYTGSGSQTGLQIYINGVNAVNSQSVLGTYVAMHNSTETAKIGCTFLNNATYEEFHDGNIQNVRVWSRALTAEEVWSIYENPWLGSAYQASAAAVYYNYILRNRRFRRLA